MRHSHFAGLPVPEPKVFPINVMGFPRLPEKSDALRLQNISRRSGDNWKGLSSQSSGHP